jgi:hypothetical protein
MNRATGSVILAALMTMGGSACGRRGGSDTSPVWIFNATESRLQHITLAGVELIGEGGLRPLGKKKVRMNTIGTGVAIAFQADGEPMQQVVNLRTGPDDANGVASIVIRKDFSVLVEHTEPSPS